MKSPNPVILTVSFGTRYAQTRARTIDAIEEALRNAYPRYEVRRAFASPSIIRLLRQQENLEVDSVSQALQRLADEGVTRVLIQPTYLMPGGEYDGLRAEAETFRSRFERLCVAGPLLQTEQDCQCLARILLEETKHLECSDQTVVWMAHGSDRGGNEVYENLQRAFASLGSRQLVGTMEGTPDVEDTIRRAAALGVSNVVLRPMMMVAGKHANEDMAGPEETSWKSRFLRAGFHVRCVPEGIGQNPQVHDMIIRHAAEGLRNL